MHAILTLSIIHHPSIMRKTKSKGKRLLFQVKNAGDVALVDEVEGWDAAKPESLVDVMIVEPKNDDKRLLEQLLGPNPAVFVRGVDTAPPPRGFSTREVILIVLATVLATALATAAIFHGLGSMYSVRDDVIRSPLKGVTMAFFCVTLVSLLYGLHKVFPARVVALCGSLMLAAQPYAEHAFDMLHQRLVAYWDDYSDTGDEPPPT